MPTLNEVLMSRFPADSVPDAAKAALVRTLAFHDEVRDQQTKVEGNKNLSPIGRRDAMQKYIAENAHELHRVAKTVDVMRAKLAERRSKLAPAAPDKTDMSAAILRSEMRTMLRGMNTGQRMALLLSPDPDPVLLQAVLEAPNFASGVTDQTRELVVSTVTERIHPGALAHIEQAEEAITVLDAAARVTFDVVRAVVEFPNNAVLTDFVEKSVGATAQLDADIDRNFASLAEVA